MIDENGPVPRRQVEFVGQDSLGHQRLSRCRDAAVEWVEPGARVRVLPQSATGQWWFCTKVGRGRHSEGVDPDHPYSPTIVATLPL
jgi:hypothetical protein